MSTPKLHTLFHIGLLLSATLFWTAWSGTAVAQEQYTKQISLGEYGFGEFTAEPVLPNSASRVNPPDSVNTLTGTASESATAWNKKSDRTNRLDFRVEQNCVFPKKLTVTVYLTVAGGKEIKVFSDSGNWGSFTGYWQIYTGPNKKVSFRVKRRAEGTFCDNSKTLTATGWTSGLKAPTKVAATTGGSDQSVTLSWAKGTNLASNEFGYYVYKNGIFIRSLSSSQLSYVGTTTPATTDTWGVATRFYGKTQGGVFNPAQTSSRPEKTATTAPFKVPANFIASDDTTVGYVRLNWNSDSDYATHLRLYRDDVLINTLPKSQTFYLDFSALPGVEHNYRLHAFNSSAGVESDPATDMGRAFLFAASDGSETGSVKLLWTSLPASFAEEVRIKRGNSELGVFTASQTTLDDKDALPGKLSEYAITALDANRNPVLSATDFGFLPANGQISGTVKTPGATTGGGVKDVLVSALPTTDTLSKALELDGVDDYVRVRDEPQLRLTDAMTIEFWIKGVTTKNTVILEKGGNNLNYHFQTSDATMAAGGDRIFFGISPSTAGRVVSSSSVMDGRWHHIAGVFDSPTTTLKLYVDGVLDNMNSNATDVPTPNFSPLNIGSRAGNSGVPAIIDEIRIWNTARSDSAISTDMNRILKGNETGLVAYWPFNAGTGTVAGDYAFTGGHHGEIFGNAVWTLDKPDVKYSSLTDDRGEGRYLIEGIYYGTRSEFAITPFKEGHGFNTPSTLFRTLENTPLGSRATDVSFIDTTSFSISGKVSFFSEPSCGAQNIQIMIDGVVSGVTDSEGNFSVAVPQAGDYTIKPVLGNHTFEPTERTLSIQGNLGGLTFLDKATVTLSGNVLSGCQSFIGPADIAIKSLDPKICISRIVTTDAAGKYSIELPAQKYSVELQSIANPDSGTIVGYFNKDTLDLTFSGSTFNYIYHAPPQIRVSGPYAVGCDNFANVPVMRQFRTDTLAIEIFERYVYNGQETTCPVDSGQLVLDDRISDDTPEHTIDFKGGMIKYALTPGLPNILADNAAHPYQKLLKITANVERYSATHDFWSLVTGHKPRPGEPFSTVSPELPLIILHDPPGDMSYSFLEKETTRTLGIGMSFELDGSVRAFGEAKVGGGAEIPGVGSTGGFVKVGKSLEVGGSVATEASMDLTITARERLSTSDDEQVTGRDGDVFVGGAYNVTYGITDVLKYTNCGVDISQAIVWGSSDFATRYFYTENYVRENLIPELQFLADNAGSADKAAKFLDAIEVWQQVLNLNEQYKKNAPIVKQNISFSGNLGVEESETVTQTLAAAVEFNLYIEESVATSAGVKAGDFNEAEGGVQVRARFDFGASLSTSVSHSNTVGYFLGDDDAGDDFTTNIKGDPVYGTPIFQVVGGTSSNPWEGLPSQPRDGLFMSIDDSSKTDIPSDQSAIFKLRLFNTSPTNETREYTLSLIQSSNPGGARVRVGDQFVDNLPFTIPAQDFQEVTVDVSRLPGHPFAYRDLQLRMYAEQDPQFADTVSFSVSYIKPCSEITLVKPESNWNITQVSGELVNIVLADYDASDPNLQAIRLEYSKDEVNWQQIAKFSGSELPADSLRYSWDASQRTNGTYLLRAVAECTFGENYSFLVSGFIDRSSWSGDLLISDAAGQGTQAKLSFGQSSMANPGLDTDLGESELPPSPPQGVFYAGFELPVEPGVASRADFRNSDGLTATWRLKFQPGPGGYPILFSWDPTSLPSGDFFLQDNITGALINIDMKQESRYLLDNSAITTLNIEFNSSYQCQQVAAAAGWNIISVPLESNDMFKDTIFPTAVSQAFAFDNGYHEDQLLQSAVGYWMKFDKPDTVEVCGHPSNVTSIAVKEGWNMIGPFDANIQASDISTTPSGIVTSQFFGYNAGYQVADVLQSGKGYWVQASQNGLLDLTPPSTLAKHHEVAALESKIDESWGRIIVTDRDGNEMELYVAETRVDPRSYSLPPVPPEGIFDARFASGAFVVNLGETTEAIKIHSATYPVRITADGLRLRVKDKITGEFVNKVLEDNDSIVVTNPNIASLEVATETIPERFELLQNYPNPFNPSTTIKFNLPKDSRVKLTVYNVLGQVVTELIDKDLAAGEHQIKLNASQYATGVYLYKLEAGDFTALKKMLLVK